jgi:hypothetical protein
VIRAALAAMAVALALPAHAQPQPPCGGTTPVPLPAKPGSEPTVATWSDVRWDPPACLPWRGGQFCMLIALAGTFRHGGDADALLARVGALSKRKGMQYWSVRDKAWRVLIEDAAALAAPQAGQRRADFTPAEMRAGAALYYEETDNRSSTPVVYRMRVLESTSERVVVETENLSPIRAFMVTVFPAGSLRSAYFLERRDAHTWTVYGLSATGGEANSLAAGSAKSYVNRATAFYRYLTGEKR